MPRRRPTMTLRQLGTAVGLGVLVIWLVFLDIGIFKKEQLARTKVSETRAELAALAARQGLLSGTVSELDTDRGQEGSLRETFGVAKPGEDVIIVVPKKTLPPPPEPTFWQRLKQTLGF